MGRLFLFIVLLSLLVVIVLILTTLVARAMDLAQNILSPTNVQFKEGLMVPTPFQKITYVALLVLLFGVATGWLGGL